MDKPTEEEKPERKFNPSFYEWAADTMNASARAAWTFKEEQIQVLLSEWNQSVMYGKEQLKKTIDELVKANHDLKIQIKLLKNEEPKEGEPVIEISRG